MKTLAKNVAKVRNLSNYLDERIKIEDMPTEKIKGQIDHMKPYDTKLVNHQCLKYLTTNFEI